MKHFLLNLLLGLFRALVLLKRALLRTGMILGVALFPFFRLVRRYIAVPIFSITMRCIRNMSRSRRYFIPSRSLLSMDSLSIALVFVIISIIFIGDSRVYADEPAHLDVPLLTLLVDNHYNENEIGQLVDAEESEGDHDVIPESLPFGGTVSGGRAIVVSTVLPGAPEEGTRRSISTYVVEKGDTLGGIAEKNGVSVETILWENKLSLRSSIRPGDVLKILPTTGVRHVVKKGDTLLALANKYGVASEKIKLFNRLDDETGLLVGDTLLIPDGRPLAVPVPPRSSVIVYAPLSIPRGRDGGSALLWPTSGHVITQYYHARHSGMDIDGDYASPIYASEDGTVVIAGWNPKGYGNYVIIDHGGGLKTLYAHSSKLFVTKGQQVTRGEVIAMVGTTGRSTGTHLHYEVRVGNQRMNPLRYIR